MGFHKVVVQFEVLCEDDDARDEVYNASLEDLHSMTMDGHFSGRFLEPSSDTELTGKEMATALIAQGSDPEFFQIDEAGNKLEEE